MRFFPCFFFTFNSCVGVSCLRLFSLSEKNHLAMSCGKLRSIAFSDGPHVVSAADSSMISGKHEGGVSFWILRNRRNCFTFICDVKVIFWDGLLLSLEILHKLAAS